MNLFPFSGTYKFCLAITDVSNQSLLRFRLSTDKITNGPQICIIDLWLMLTVQFYPL